MTLCLLKVMAQHKVYEQFTEKEGLPSNTVYDIAQDPEGYMWFATDNSLSRFDGTTFTTFSISNGLPDNEILKLLIDSQGRIWLMGFNGNVGYIYKGLFFNKDNTTFLKELSSENSFDLAYEDYSGNIWFYGRNSRISCLTKDSQVIKSDYNVKTIFTKTFAELKDKRLYLISNFPRNEKQQLEIKDAGIKIKNGASSSAKKSLFSDSIFVDLRKKGFYIREDTLGMRFYNTMKHNTNGFNTFWPPKIYAEPPNEYWAISNFTGLHKFTEASAGANMNFSKTDFAASSYFKDSEGNEWVSSINDGVLFFPKTSINIINFDDTNDLQVVFKSKNSLIYVGDYLGNLSSFDENKRLIKIVKNDQTRHSNISPNKINDILEYGNHIITIHSNDIRLHERKNKTLTTKRAILSISAGKKGFIIKDSLYVASSNNVYCILLKPFLKSANWSDKQMHYFTQPKDYLADNEYRKVLWKNRGTAILKSSNNNIWIGTNKGLYFMENDSIVPYRPKSDFSKSNITDIKELNDGIVLVATNGYGLGVIENENSYFINRIGEEINPVINSITIDKDNGIWLATNTGLSGAILENSKLLIKERYTTLDGLSSKNIRNLIVNDTLIHATSPNGLNLINRVKTANGMYNIPIHLNKITVNEIHKDSFNLNALKHYQNDLYISFNGVSFKSGKDIRYNYRLMPWETEWIVTANKEIRYSNLPPNNYLFEVKAIDKDGLESHEPATFSFAIYSAWYDNNIIKMLGVLIAILLTWYLISSRIKSIRTQSTYNEKIAVLKHQALLAQMNPHFINNSLSSIQQFILSHDVNQAQSQLTRFANLISAILANSKKIAITLTDELNLVENYLKLECIRFDKGFSFEIDVSVKEPDSIEIPSMIIQPIVENAIVHGVSALKEKQGKIHIDIREKEEHLQCIVTDNGIGIRTSMALKNNSILLNNSMALSNIEERLELYHGDESKIITEELYDETDSTTGTKVTVLIPIINRI